MNVIYTLDVMEDIGFAIKDSFRSLMLTLFEIICRLIIFLFQAFEYIANMDILKNETIRNWYDKIGLLLGLFMLFRLTLSFIQYMINPDLMTSDKKGVGNIVKRVFVVIVALGVTPTVFEYAFVLQSEVLEQNIIPKIIMAGDGKPLPSNEDFGVTLAWYTFESFYKKNSEVESKLKNEDPEASVCPELTPLSGNNGSFIQDRFIEGDGSLTAAFNCLNTKTEIQRGTNKAKVYDIDFDGDGLIPVGVGAVMLWILFTYTIQVGVRVLQLAYLQLIAPIPIMLYLDPSGDDRFNKWIKQCTTTYLDVFMRVAIIYFIVFVCNLIMNNFTV